MEMDIVFWEYKTEGEEIDDEYDGAEDRALGNTRRLDVNVFN